MDVVPRFPLLQLPNEERIEVLRHMIPLQLIKLSFLSKKAKQLVISLKFKAHSVSVFIGNEIYIIPSYKYNCPFYNSFYLAMGHENDDLKRMKKPTHIYFSEYDDLKKSTYEWKNEKFELKDWLDHFHTIFHCKETGIALYENAFQYDFDSIHDHFKNPDILLMSDTGNVDYNNRIMKSLIPNKDITVDLRVFGTQKVPQTLLIQNFNDFRGDGEPQRDLFLLNDLLCTNAKEIRLYNASFSRKDINRFLKLWVSGSNPRLESLMIHCVNRAIPSSDILVEGIKHVRLPDDHVKVFVPHHRRNEWDVRGGSEIMRKDGTKGTVRIHKDWITNFVFFYVWNEHNCG